MFVFGLWIRDFDGSRFDSVFVLQWARHFLYGGVRWAYDPVRWGFVLKKKTVCDRSSGPARWADFESV